MFTFIVTDSTILPIGVKSLGIVIDKINYIEECRGSTSSYINIHFSSGSTRLNTTLQEFLSKVAESINKNSSRLV